jgi:hypothetical protein
LREGKVGKRIVPLNDIEEAFELFMALLVPSVIDVRGEEVSFDIGDYVHIMDEEQIREVYISTIYRSEDDLQGQPFIVEVNRRYGGLDFRTAFVPKPGYLEQVKKGRLLWKAKN